MYDYEAGIDEPMRLARTITRESEVEAAEAFDLAKRHPLPVGYIVKAVIRCNQLDPFRMIACDGSKTIEARREAITTLAHKWLGVHFKTAHPYMTREQRIGLHSAVHFNFRDIG